jgi:hypothetical protein
MKCKGNRCIAHMQRGGGATQAMADELRKANAALAAAQARRDAAANAMMKADLDDYNRGLQFWK